MLKNINEARDDEFSFNRLRILPYEKRLEYCYSHLGDSIGNGSSRVVFQINDEWVLKLAKNRAGAAQNKVEVPDRYQNTLDIFPHVDEQLSDMEDYYYIVSEYVIPLGEDSVDYDLDTSTDGDEDLDACLDVDMTLSDFFAFIEQCASQYDDRGNEYWSWDEFQELIDNDATLNSINDYMTNYQFDGWGDWQRVENIGMTIRDGEPHIVFLDNGFNRDIAKKYYSYFSDGLGKFDDTNEHWGLSQLIKKFNSSDNMDEKLQCIFKLFPYFLKEKGFNAIYNILVKQNYDYDGLVEYICAFNNVLKDEFYFYVKDKLGNDYNNMDVFDRFQEILYGIEHDDSEDVLDDYINNEINESINRFLIKEGLNNNDSFLYHNTSSENLLKMMETNSMHSDYHRGYNNNGQHNGICFTRIKSYNPYAYYNVLMVFKAESLLRGTRGLKLIPYADAEYDYLDEYEERLVSKNGNSFVLDHLAERVDRVIISIERIVNFVNENGDYADYAVNELCKIASNNIFGNKLKIVFDMKSMKEVELTPEAIRDAYFTVDNGWDDDEF